MSFNTSSLESKRNGRASTATRRQAASRNTLLKVVILGNGGVGKSCLMNRFVSNHFDQHSFHTIGVEFMNKDIEICGDTYKLQIWDTAGQERFKSLRTPFYRGTDVCLLTYAVNDHKSFQDISMWYHEFLKYADVKEGSSFPFVVVGNKADVNASQRQVTQEEVSAWCQEHGNFPCIETSAKDAINVELAFKLAVEHWAIYEEKLYHQPYENGTIDLRNIRSSHKGSCCMKSNRTLSREAN